MMRSNLTHFTAFATLAVALFGVVPPALSQTGAPPAAQGTARCALECRIDRVVDGAPFHRAQWGIEVRDVATGETLYARNAGRHFIPASNLKLVVAAAASHLLGPEFRVRTGVYATGPVEDGTVRGDLVLYGRGDPTLSARYAATRTAALEALGDSLWARGVRRVAGGVIADESHWDSAQARGDWEAYDLRWWYAAPVGALGFNDNAIDFRVAPGARVGAPARISAEPRTDFYRFENRTTTVTAGRPHTLDFNRVPGTNRVYAYGEIPLGTAPRTESFAVVDPARYTGTMFRDALERRGIDVERTEVRTVSDPAASATGKARPLAEIASPPLARWIDPILLTSQNWFAEQLLWALGRETRGEGSWEAGIAAETEFLTRVVGIDSTAFVLRDGSGLSAGNLITPHALVQLLLWARQSPSGALVRQALPVAGGTGSLRARLTDLSGRVAAKTGYIGNVDSLSGYVTLADGREVAVSIIANASGIPSSRMKDAIDEVVRAVAAAGR